jgi:hypothetical protein
VKRLALVMVAACSSGPTADTAPPRPVTPDAAVASIPPPGTTPPVEQWLKGNTHVHAAPSGDSRTGVLEVIRWYREHAYDFIVLTDHNRVSQVNVDGIETVAAVAHASAVDGGVDAATVYYSTEGDVAVYDEGPIVLAGIELTYNPGACTAPDPEPEGKCRIHANLLGVTARPVGKVEWANRDSLLRLDSYQAAIDQAKLIGGLVQINHGQWWWGMTADLLVDLARRGVVLVEIANQQFNAWNAGDATHPSMEALWDSALTSGVDLWGVASDDAHDYEAEGGGKYPAGGGWIMVYAARDPDAILAAIAAGRFYSSTGVELARAEVVDGSLIVQVADTDPGEHTITFIGDGQVLSESQGLAARQVLSAASYVRAVVTRDDGAKAWTQPIRGP